MMSIKNHVTAELFICLSACLYAVLCSNPAALPSLQELTKTCNGVFTIERPVDEDLTVNIRTRQKYCKGLPNKTSPKGRSASNYLTPSFSVENKSLEIAWIDGATRSDEGRPWRYSPKYIVQLGLLQKHPDRNTSQMFELTETTCVQLRLPNRRAYKNLETRFHLDSCIPLVNVPNIFISAKVWSLGDGQRSCDFVSHSNRRKRSIINTSCYQCSSTRYHPLSKESGTKDNTKEISDYNKLQLCMTFKDDPVMSYKILPSKQLNIVVSSLKPFLDDVILHFQQNTTLLEMKTFRGDAILNQSVKFVTHDVVPPGNYTLHLNCKCRVGEDVPHSIDLHYEQCTGWVFNIQVLPSERPVTGRYFKFWHLVAVGTVVLVAVIIGVVVFIYCRRMDKPKSSSQSTGQPSNNIYTESIPLPEYPRSSDFVHRTFVEESHGHYEDVEKKKEQEPLLHDGKDMNNGEERSVLLLSQPNSSDAKLNDLAYILPGLLSDPNLRLFSDRSTQARENWLDFASEAAKDCSTLVVLLSKDLCDLCLLDRRDVDMVLTTEESARLEKLLQERDYERIPCVVLDGLTKRLSTPDGNPGKSSRTSGVKTGKIPGVTVVLVVETSDNIVRKFCNEFSCLVSTNCRRHVINADQLLEQDEAGKITLSGAFKQLLQSQAR